MNISPDGLSYTVAVPEPYAMPVGSRSILIPHNQPAGGIIIDNSRQSSPRNWRNDSSIPTPGTSYASFLRQYHEQKRDGTNFVQQRQEIHNHYHGNVYYGNGTQNQPTTTPSSASTSGAPDYEHVTNLIEYSDPENVMDKLDNYMRNKSKLDFRNNENAMTTIVLKAIGNGRDSRYIEAIIKHSESGIMNFINRAQMV
jgi:hypothetical protein